LEDSDLEDAYDLREVSSDVEMHPDDLLSDARYASNAFLYLNSLLLMSPPAFHSRLEDADEQPVKSLKRAHDDADNEGDHPKPSKSDKKKKLKGENGKAVPAPEVAEEKEKGKTKKDKEKAKAEGKEAEKQAPAEGKKAVEREVTGGIKILDSKVGTGPMAKKGNVVRMRYIGKLQNGKIFDKNVKGKPVSDYSSFAG
jgi:FK506-binding nuclear protein